MYQWTGDMLEERQHVYKSMREVQGVRVRQNAHMYNINPEYQSGVSSVVF